MKTSTQYPNFHHVPGLERYLINRDGVVIDTTRQVCPLPTMAAGYRIVYSDGTTYHIHRLKALTFLDPPVQPVTELDVNHKDGNKLNNEPSNLEWVTRSENCLHAYRTGLREDNTPILVKDLRDDSVSSYYSLQECARAFGVQGSRIHQFMKPHNRKNVIMGHYVFIYEGETWPPLTKDDIGRYRNGTAKSVTATDEKTGKVIIFESHGAAAKQLGFTRQSVTHQLSKREPTPYKGWIFRYLDDPELHKVRKRHPNQGGARRKPTPIKVTDHNGRVTYWDSTEKFGQTVGVSKNTIQAGVNRNDGMWRGYKVEYQ